MNEIEITGLLAAIHGLYGTTLDDVETKVWVREMVNVERADAEAALEHWKKANPHWAPKAAELLERINVERVKREFAAIDHQDEGVRCDGTRWITVAVLGGADRMEPCPTCNPLLRAHWENSRYDQDNWSRPVKAAPEDWVPPPPCYHDRGEPVTDADTARAAIKRGYVEQKSRDGFDLDQIEEDWANNVWVKDYFLPE